MALKNIYTLFLLPIVSVAFAGAVHAAPGDFDGDGLSDHSVALVNKNVSNNTGNTAWLTRLAGGGLPYFWTWNVPADAFVTGRYFAGDSRYYPGVVWVRSAQLPLEWYIKNPANQDIVLQYGFPGDSIPNQADVDGDGVTDFAVIRVVANNALAWYFALSGSGGGIVQVIFGENGDKPGLSDVNGDGVAELVVLRPGTYVWYVRTLHDVNFTQVQWGLDGDIPILPRDMDGDHLPDYIIARRTGSLQAAYIRYGNGETAVYSLGLDTSIPQVGNFVSAGAQDFSWWQRDTGWNATRNPDGSLNFFMHGIPTNVLVRADGTVVPANQDGTFGSTSGGGGGGGGGGGFVTCNQTATNGYLYKPESQDSGGTREGYPMILLDDFSISSGCMKVLAANLQEFSCFGKYSSNRAYEGWTCGLNDDPPCNGRDSSDELAAQSTAIGGTPGGYVFDPGDGRCYAVPDFRERHDVR